MDKSSSVITGIGLITPLGCGRELSWQKIKQGQSLKNEPLALGIANEYQNVCRMSPLPYVNGLPRVFSLSLLAAKEAIADSGLDLNSLDTERIGCTVSVSKPILSDQLPYAPDAVGQHLCRSLNIRGPQANLVAACATGVHSLLLASRWLQEKKCDLVIAGAAESSLHPLYMSGFRQMGVLSDTPCPFDRRRNGFMISEGAGILLLERKKDALARKAVIRAEVLVCTIGSDYHQPTQFFSDGSTVASLLRRALKDSLMTPDQVDYVNLHGTGTKLNDLVETRAIKTVFGKLSYDLALSSTKAATGHLLGASGAVEAGITCLALQDQFVPPTLYLEQPDPDCDLDYTPLKGKNKFMKTAVSLSFGFGGSIGAVILRSC